MKCSLASRSIIAVSIKGGYRTKEDWERYFAMRKANIEGDTGEWTEQRGQKPSRAWIMPSRDGYARREWALQDVMQEIGAGTETAPLPEAVKEEVQQEANVSVHRRC